MLQLSEADHDALKMPMAFIPATYCSNVPGVRCALGANTALNEIAKTCDKLLQNAPDDKTVYVVELAGVRYGYLAAMAGLATGADAVFVSEAPRSYQQALSNCLAQPDVQRGLILHSESHDSDAIVTTLNRVHSGEGKRFEKRSFHLDQVGKPSPFDRQLGVTVGVAASEWICYELEAHKHSVVLVGSQGDITPLGELSEQTDFG